MKSLNTRIRLLFQGSGIGAILLRASSGTFAIKVIGAGIAFLIQIWLARLLEISEYGVYVYVLAWISFLVLFAKVGLDVVIVRYVPVYKKNKRWDLFRGLLRDSFTKVSIYSFCISLSLILVTYSLSSKIGSNQMYTFWVAAILLPILALTSLRNSALQGMKHVIMAQVPETIIRPLILGVLTGLLFLYSDTKLTSIHAMSLNIAAATISFAIGTYLLFKKLPAEVRVASPEYNKQEWLKMSLPMFFIAGMNLLLHQSDIMMLGAILTTDSAAVYGAAVRIAGLVSFGLTAVNAIVAPMISEYYVAKNIQGLQRMITLAARGIFIFTIFMCCSLWFLGDFLLGLFGEEFKIGYLPLTILLIAQAVSAIAGSVGFLMVMTGNQKKAAAVIGSSAVMNITLNAVLIPLYGMIGAAIATTISTAFWNLVMLYHVKQKININPTAFARLKA